MMPLRKTLAWTLASLLVFTLACDGDLPTGAQHDGESPVLAPGGGGGGGGGKPGGETAGNNLSYPVIWAEGVQKVLPGTPGMEPVLNGVWWYWWGTTGTDPNITPLSCLPDPADESLCDDGNPPGEGAVKAYVQKDPLNLWQAGSADWSAAPVDVHWIDWGDNLESVDWYTRSQVRTEVVLFQDLAAPMLEYEMRHVDGWGIDEVHGLAFNGVPMVGPGTRATVYSPCARLTIQKLTVERDDPLLDRLVWVPEVGWTDPDVLPEDVLVREPIFNKVVYEAGDGPGYYNAEINVKGRIIYGYTWSVRKLNDSFGGTAAGDYRATYSFDQDCGTVDLNTYFVEGTTQIMVPIEEVVTTSTEGDDGGDTGGATAMLVPAVFDPDTGELTGGNLTYIDIRILERGGGGGGGGGPPDRRR